MDLLIVLLSFLDLVIPYFFAILLPVLVLYFIYLIITKAFSDMGFSTFEAILIVFASFLLGSGLIDEYVGVSFSNIPLFTYHTYWIVGINAGGAVIPILLSIYLSVKNRLKPVPVLLGIGGIAVVTFCVTYPDPEKGIVSTFPYWILPILAASFLSLVVCRKEKKRLHRLHILLGRLGCFLVQTVFI